MQDVDAPLGEIVNRISLNASALVREEIELAKAEMEIKFQRLVRGAIIGATAGFFVFLGLIFVFHTLAWGLNDVFGSLWLGFLITTGVLMLLAAIAGLHRVQALPGRRAADARSWRSRRQSAPRRCSNTRRSSRVPTRSPQEIRASIDRNRRELVGSVEDLRVKVHVLTDWRRQINEHRTAVIAGAAVLGFVVGGGLRALRRRS